MPKRDRTRKPIGILVEHLWIAGLRLWEHYVAWGPGSSRSAPNRPWYTSDPGGAQYHSVDFYWFIALGGGGSLMVD